MKTRRQKCVYILCSVLMLMGWVMNAAGQSASAAPQSASRPGSITGEWQGAVSRLRLTLKIEQPADAPLKGTMISVDQGNAAIPIDTVTFDHEGTLGLDMKSIGASYDGKLSADGTEIRGTASVPPSWSISVKIHAAAEDSGPNRAGTLPHLRWQHGGVVRQARSV
jgi:hypothetical protein